MSETSQHSPQQTSSETEIGKVLGAAEKLAKQIVDADARAKSAEHEKAEALYKADHDPLTGLLTKAAFKDALSKTIEASEKENLNFGILFIDLKDFKKVNDTQGHEVGDKVLTSTAEVIKTSAVLLSDTLRTQGENPDLIASEPRYDSETAGRLGGDEFAIIVNLEPRADSSDRSLSPGERLDIVKQRITQAFTDNQEIAVTGAGISIGGAVWQDGMSTEAMLSVADNEMFKHKEEQRAEQGSYR